MARAWARPGGATDEEAIAEDMRRFGADHETIRERLEADQNDAPAVLPANADAIRVFLAADSQWRLAPSGAPLGLDYQGVRAVMAMLGMEGSPDLLERLSTLEAEATRLLGDRVVAEQKRAAAKARRGGSQRSRPRRRR